MCASDECKFVFLAQKYVSIRHDISIQSRGLLCYVGGNPNSMTKLEQLVSTINKEALTSIRYFQVDPDRDASASKGIKRTDALLEELELKNENLTHTQECYINALMVPHDCDRERVWLEITRAHLKENTHFICGYTHCDSFSHLLAENGFKSMMLRVII